ncbi:hypothetical protein M407DRAFT_24691 [Tulasnella calospora MUT 4182]|uniref:Uncharacterized protein n=1 Tax=Tulasnella calospora MUT 4182 TaxID=1051891 RepID=A0A0C3LX81_9AGAM|nr:hypothetical protein M407DRAFT_24691 [Tulasnella calospora MUT 4182]
MAKSPRLRAKPKISFRSSGAVALLKSYGTLEIFYPFSVLAAEVAIEEEKTSNRQVSFCVASSCPRMTVFELDKNGPECSLMPSVTSARVLSTHDYAEHVFASALGSYEDLLIFGPMSADQVTTDPRRAKIHSPTHSGDTITTSTALSSSSNFSLISHA